MPKSNWELWGIIIARIEFDINFYVYNQTKSALNILIIMVASLILALASIISNIYYKIKDLEENQDKFNQKLIRDKELEDIRLDIREIKRETFKKK